MGAAALTPNLNHNGQAITLSKKLADKGAVGGPSPAKLWPKARAVCTAANRYSTFLYTRHGPVQRAA